MAEGQSHSCAATSCQVDSSRSDRSGVTPSVPSKAVPTEMRDATKACGSQETASIRVHIRLHALESFECCHECCVVASPASG